MANVFANLFKFIASGINEFTNILCYEHHQKPSQPGNI